MNFPSDLAQDVFLLLLTAFLVPLVLKQVDDRKNRDQQRFEADLARQGKVIDSQVALIETLAGLLWEYQLRAIDVLFYRQPSTGRPELYQQAVEEYEAQAGRQLAKVRAEISKLLRLAPQHVYDDFLSLYYDDLLDVDTRISVMIRQDELARHDLAASGDKFGVPEPSWSSLQHQLVFDLAQKVDIAIELLATELGLTWQASSKGTLPVRAEPTTGTSSPETHQSPELGKWHGSTPG